MAKGNFIEYVVSDNPDKYPNDGEQGGYYYELFGKPKTLISFTIEGTSFQAEGGMTWAEWVASSYNTGGYLNSEGIVFNSLGQHVLYNGGVISIEAVIIANHAYSLSGHSG